MIYGEQRADLTVKQVCGLVFEAAGIGSGAVMREAPDVVMPSELIGGGCARILRERGIDVEEIPGYARAAS